MGWHRCAGSREGASHPWTLWVHPVGTAVPSHTPLSHCSPMTSCFLASKSQIPVPFQGPLFTSWVKCLYPSLQATWCKGEAPFLDAGSSQAGSRAPSQCSQPTSTGTRERPRESWWPLSLTVGSGSQTSPERAKDKQQGSESFPQPELLSPHLHTVRSDRISVS